MKEHNKLFMWLFIALGAASLTGAVSGATHQLFITAICAIMAASLYSQLKPRTNDRTNP